MVQPNQENQENLPTCPKGCSVPGSATTVVLYNASRGINDYWCVVCNFRWPAESSKPNESD